MAGIAVRVALKVILMLRLRLPERATGLDLGYDFAWPKSCGVDIGDRLFRNLPLLAGRIENRGAIAGAGVISLPVQCCGVMYLKEKFKQLPITELRGVEAHHRLAGWRPPPRTGDGTMHRAD